jgi:hypothetical protein
MELFKDTNFDFLRRKWWFIVPSLILTLAGMVSLVVKGGPRYPRRSTSSTSRPWRRRSGRIPSGRACAPAWSGWRR